MSKPRSDYMLLFRGPHWDQGLSPEEVQRLIGQVMAWFDALKAQGRVKAGQPLDDQRRLITGKKAPTISDGPFAESKEAVGGYLLISAADLDEAEMLARACPTLDRGISIEIRPVLDECPIFKRERERLLVGTN